MEVISCRYLKPHIGLYQKMETASFHTPTLWLKLLYFPLCLKAFSPLSICAAMKKAQWKQLKIICCSRKVWMIDGVIFAPVGLKT